MNNSTMVSVPQSKGFDNNRRLLLCTRKPVTRNKAIVTKDCYCDYITRAGSSRVLSNKLGKRTFTPIITSSTYITSAPRTLHPSHPASLTPRFAQLLVSELPNTMMLASLTSSAAPSFSRGSMKKSLADELDCAFENIDLSPIYTVEMVESPKASYEGMMMEDIRTTEDVVPEGHEGHSKSPGLANDDPESHVAVKEDGVELHTANNASNAAPNLPPKKSVFIEHLDPNTTSSQPISHKEQTKLMASKHNRELIDRNADGFFKMETMPSITDVKRRVQQSDGIAALQRTLVPAATSNALTSNTGSPHVSFSMTPKLGKRSSTLRNVTYAESRGVKARNHHHSPYPSAASRAKNGPRFSL